jgi:flagellar motor switch protein FliM
LAMSDNKRSLTQQEIDALCESASAAPLEHASSPKVTPFDFKLPNRIPKAQLRAIHNLHENFANSLVSRLSAYLRSYVNVNLITIEQISCSEFVDGLSPTTCVLSLALHPYEGKGILEISPALVFPILELLLGGNGRAAPELQRGLTDVEQEVLGGFFRLLLHDLSEAWKPLSGIEFSMQSIAANPQSLQALAPSEPVVAVAFEIHIGDNTGMMNIAIPGIVIKMTRQRIDRHVNRRHTTADEGQQAAMLARLLPALLGVDVRLAGPTLSFADLLQLQVNDVLVFEYPVDRPLSCLINGVHKFSGKIVRNGARLCLNLG